MNFANNWIILSAFIALSSSIETRKYMNRADLTISLHIQYIPSIAVVVPTAMRPSCTFFFFHFISYFTSSYCTCTCTCTYVVVLYPTNPIFVLYVYNVLTYVCVLYEYVRFFFYFYFARANIYFDFQTVQTMGLYSCICSLSLLATCVNVFLSSFRMQEAKKDRLQLLCRMVCMWSYGVWQLNIISLGAVQSRAIEWENAKKKKIKL